MFVKFHIVVVLLAAVSLCTEGVLQDDLNLLEPVKENSLHTRYNGLDSEQQSEADELKNLYRTLQSDAYEHRRENIDVDSEESIVDNEETLEDILTRSLNILQERGIKNGALTKKQRIEILAAHNEARRQVRPTAADMREMLWDKRLARTAKLYAKKCIWAHNSRRSNETKGFSYVGENLFATSGNILNATRALGAWNNEKAGYDYYANKCKANKVCGHYTQVVWAKSNRLGCGSWKCPGKIILVCNYGPGGNYNGRKPYISGQTCSQCPAGTFCRNKLCA